MTRDPSRCCWSFAGRRATANATGGPDGWDQSTGTDSVAHCSPSPHPFQVSDPAGFAAAPAETGRPTVTTATSAPIVTNGRQDKAATVPTRSVDPSPGAVPSERDE